MDAQQAWQAAASWGSYMRDGDPGSIFYTLTGEELQVEDEDHRKALLEYTHELMMSEAEDLQQVTAEGKWDKVGECADRIRELADLHIYFTKVKVADEKVWFTSSSGSIEIEMTRKQASSANHTGQCDADVEALMRVPEIAEQLGKIDPAKLRRELKEYGIWETKELQDHQTNLSRIVWIAAGDIDDGNCDNDDNQPPASPAETEK